LIPYSLEKVLLMIVEIRLALKNLAKVSE